MNVIVSDSEGDVLSAFGTGGCVRSPATAPTPTMVPTAAPTQTPDRAVLLVGNVKVDAGGTEPMIVRLETAGRMVAGIQHTLILDPPVPGIGFGVDPCICRDRICGSDAEHAADILFLPEGCSRDRPSTCTGIRVTALAPGAQGFASGAIYECDVTVDASVAPGTTVAARITNAADGPPCAGASFVGEGDEEEPLNCSNATITVSAPVSP
jgi:hypothetical protein